MQRDAKTPQLIAESWSTTCKPERLHQTLSRKSKLTVRVMSKWELIYLFLLFDVSFLSPNAVN